jgi:hypothetical protein
VQNGFAQRYYIAGSKERTDQVSDQTATIVDCAARTVTTLDLRKKTYRVVSMDQSSPPNSPNSGGATTPAPRATDDFGRIAIVITNTALGAREVGGQPTSGFGSQVSYTQTKPSGQTQSYNGDLVGYYSTYANPVPGCSRVPPVPDRNSAPNAADVISAMTLSHEQLMQGITMAGMDPRFSLQQSGPPLPRDKLAMYEAATFAGGRAGRATLVIERGNVRNVGTNDPIFSVPADFTPASP